MEKPLIDVVTEEINGAFFDGKKDYAGCTRERVEDTRKLIRDNYVPTKEIGDWCAQCFGEDTAKDKQERVHRFTEEALELGQATGLTRENAYKLVDYVFGRPVGEVKQEVGGTMLTLGALCYAHGIDQHQCARAEMDRCDNPEIMEKIRTKQKNKEIRSAASSGEPDPLPGSD